MLHSERLKMNPNMQMDIQELFQEGTLIPSLPEIFYQFKEVIDDPASSFDEIGEIVGNDPGLTIRLLKIVNSTFFGFSQQIETISHAISIIGREQLNDLLFSTLVRDQFKSIPQSTLNMASFWKHSIASGLFAKNLALGIGEANPDRSFVAGLLHDIGHLVLCLELPLKVLEISQRVKSKDETQHKAEFEVLGFNHADVGGFLMRTWKLPKALEEAVGFHHNPADATEFPVEASIAHVADIFADSLDSGVQDKKNILIPTMDEFASEQLQIPKNSSFPNIKKQVEKELEEVVQVFLQPA